MESKSDSISMEEHEKCGGERNEKKKNAKTCRMNKSYCRWDKKVSLFSSHRKPNIAISLRTCDKRRLSIHKRNIQMNYDFWIHWIFRLSLAVSPTPSHTSRKLRSSKHNRHQSQDVNLIYSFDFADDFPTNRNFHMKLYTHSLWKLFGFFLSAAANDNLDGFYQIDFCFCFIIWCWFSVL